MLGRDYLTALGKTGPGKVLAQNILGALRSGRLGPAVVNPLLDEAARRWRLGAIGQWGRITCPASRALFDTIVAAAPAARFRGRPATGLDGLVSFVIPFSRVIAEDRFVDIAKLQRRGMGKGVRATRPLSATLAAGLNDGTYLKAADVKVGASYGIFWATSDAALSALVARRDGAASAVEQCGLYHMPPFKTALLKFTSLATLRALAAAHKFTPATPTFVEGLNNLRFLGWDLSPGQPWGSALNLRCFRLPLEEINRDDLGGAPELALPAVPFVGNFEASVVGALNGYHATDDKFYGNALERIFGIDAHVKLGDALGLPA